MTKPKIYNIAIISVLFVIFLVLYRIFKPFNEFTLGIVFGIYLSAVIVMLLDAFKKQLEYNPYSYNSIYYISFAMFVGSILFSDLVFLVRYKEYFIMEDSYSYYNILHLILGSAKNYMLYSAPLVLVICIVLVVSNIILIRKEGRSLSKILFHEYVFLQ